MMKMKKFILLLFMILIGAPVFADTVHLTNGLTVEGEIIDENSIAVTVKQGSRLRKLYRSEIEKIERDTSTANVSDSSDPSAKREVIRRFIEVTGLRQQLKRTVDEIMASATAQQSLQFERVFDVDEIIEQIIPIYDEYFTLSELQELIEFHESPVAIKFKEVMPQMMQEIMKTAIEHFQQKVNNPY